MDNNEKHYRDQVREKPKDPVAWLWLGTYLLEHSDDLEAVTTCHKNAISLFKKGFKYAEDTREFQDAISGLPTCGATDYLQN